ncbi:MAG: hypothetical protein V4703_08170, partial [Actinomycetota bacterium]
FVKPGCTPCEEVTTELARREGVLAPIVTSTLIIGAPADQVPDEHGDDRLLLDPADHNAALIGAGTRLPVAALLATDGTIVRPLAYGRDEIIQLLAVLEATAEQPGGLRPVPDVE